LRGRARRRSSGFCDGNTDKHCPTVHLYDHQPDRLWGGWRIAFRGGVVVGCGHSGLRGCCGPPPPPGVTKGRQLVSVRVRRYQLMTLCLSCHTSLHHKQGDIVKKKEIKPCRICGRPARRMELCDSHTTRYRKYGDPCITKVWDGKAWNITIDPTLQSKRPSP
jgi:hypothetical protein